MVFINWLNIFFLLTTINLVDIFFCHTIIRIGQFDVFLVIGATNAGRCCRGSAQKGRRRDDGRAVGALPPPVPSRVSWIFFKHLDDSCNNLGCYSHCCFSLFLLFLLNWFQPIDKIYICFLCLNWYCTYFCSSPTLIFRTIRDKKISLSYFRENLFRKFTTNKFSRKCNKMYFF
jgi:hypothetical protein